MIYCKACDADIDQETIIEHLQKHHQHRAHVKSDEHGNVEVFLQDEET